MCTFPVFIWHRIVFCITFLNSLKLFFSRLYVICFFLSNMIFGKRIWSWRTENIQLVFLVILIILDLPLPQKYLLLYEYEYNTYTLLLWDGIFLLKIFSIPLADGCNSHRFSAGETKLVRVQNIFAGSGLQLFRVQNTWRKESVYLGSQHSYNISFTVLTIRLF